MSREEVLRMKSDKVDDVRLGRLVIFMVATLGPLQLGLKLGATIFLGYVIINPVYVAPLNPV